MNEEKTGKCLRQVEHIRGHLLHRYCITVNQVQLLNLYEPFVRRSVFEEMCKPNVMFLISSIENFTKIVMDEVVETQ